MTIAPRRPALVFADLDEVAEAIRRQGGRLTSARRVLLEGLFASEGPVSAEYIAAGMDGSVTPSDLSSVYRNLELLEELGVVRHVHLGHGPGLYEIERGASQEYFVCEQCDRVDAVDSSQLDALRDQIREQFGYEARFTHFPITGLCAACAGAGRKPAAHTHSHGSYVHSHAHSHDHEH